ncbi:cell wall-binding repeat-containing protein [Kineococcus sp. SYSU DK004]|uniref:cell wall-binding repeat-containing protein n=1 Tax=Kineococcus sp. SYSU DK004 TaxID=3383125 RepID=UPI003D7DCCE7
MRLRPRPLAAAAALALSAGLALGSAAPASAAVTPSRIAGPDRVATAIAAATPTFSGGRAAAVVLARQDTFADSLAAAPLASDRGGPLLLTPSDRLPDAVARSIRDVLRTGGTVFLLGGQNALSAQVESAVRALPGVGTVRRVAGADRYATAVEVAKLLPGSTDVALVTGRNFPDGLSAGALMGVVGTGSSRALGVVLLTDDGVLPAVTRDHLAQRRTADSVVVAVGGQAVRAASAAGLPGVVPLAGNDRYETSAAVAQLFASNSYFEDSTTVVGIATGENWPDALAGSALLAYGGGPLVLTARDGLPPASATALTALQRDARGTGRPIVDALVFGGPGVVSDNAVSQVAAALR